MKVNATARYVPNFKGPFFTWKVDLNINREKRISDVLVVYSSGKRHKVHRFLWLKLVWDELSEEEFVLFLSMPETLNDDKMVGFLRARLDIPKRELRQRLNKIENYFGEEISDRNQYRGLMRLRIDLQKRTMRLPKTAKFSGYVRNISSLGKGSKRSQGMPEPVADSFFSIESETDWYLLLSVGGSLPAEESLNPS